jgi:hypothetical protein
MQQQKENLEPNQLAAGPGEMDLNAVWGQVVANFRQACILKRAGKTVDAEHVLRVELPRWINAWSKASAKPAREQQQDLRAMFQSEQKRVLELWSAQDVLTTSLTHRVVGSLSSLVTQELKTLVVAQLGLGNSASTSAAQSRLLTRSQGPYQRISPDGKAWDESRQTGRARQTVARLSLDDVPGAIDAVLSEQQRIACPSASKTEVLPVGITPAEMELHS